MKGLYGLTVHWQDVSVQKFEFTSVLLLQFVYNVIPLYTGVLGLFNGSLQACTPTHLATVCNHACNHVSSQQE